MSEQIIEQYGNVTIYTESNHPSPIYHVEGNVAPNPHGDLAVLFEDDNLEEVMYNGGTQLKHHRKTQQNIAKPEENT